MVHFFPPKMHPESPQGRRKEERPGKGQQSFVQEKVIPRPLHPAIVRCSERLLMPAWAPRVSKGQGRGWSPGHVLRCTNHHKEATTAPDPTWALWAQLPQHQPKLPLSFLKWKTSNVELNFTKTTSNTSENKFTENERKGPVCTKLAQLVSPWRRKTGFFPWHFAQIGRRGQRRCRCSVRRPDIWNCMEFSLIPAGHVPSEEHCPQFGGQGRTSQMYPSPCWDVPWSRASQTCTLVAL